MGESQVCFSDPLRDAECVFRVVTEKLRNKERELQVAIAKLIVSEDSTEASFRSQFLFGASIVLC